jgi:hypothetical protein
MADLKMIDWRLFEIEVARIQQNERCEGPAPEARSPCRRADGYLRRPAPETPAQNLPDKANRGSRCD